MSAAAATELATARCHLLYQQAVFASREGAQLECEIKQLKEREVMRECTFQPKLLPQRRRVSPRVQPRNFETTVSRMRAANRRRTAQYEARRRVPAGENYERLRRLGPQPFSCYFRDRAWTARRGPPLYYVDVDVGRGRSGRIGVHQGDDLRAKAISFAKAFQLGRDAVVRLEEMLHEAYGERLQALDVEGHFEGAEADEEFRCGLTFDPHQTEDYNPSGRGSGSAVGRRKGVMGDSPDGSPASPGAVSDGSDEEGT